MAISGAVAGLGTTTVLTPVGMMKRGTYFIYVGVGVGGCGRGERQECGTMMSI